MTLRDSGSKSSWRGSLRLLGLTSSPYLGEQRTGQGAIVLPGLVDRRRRDRDAKSRSCLSRDRSFYLLAKLAWPLSVEATVEAPERGSTRVSSVETFGVAADRLDCINDVFGQAIRAGGLRVVHPERNNDLAVRCCGSLELAMVLFDPMSRQHLRQPRGGLVLHLLSEEFFAPHTNPVMLQASEYALPARTLPGATMSILLA